MKKVKTEELFDLIIKNFKAPISLLEVKKKETRLIKGLPITYLLRFISRIAEENPEYNGEVEIEEISKELLKIKLHTSIIIVEQDTDDNVLNFDIG